MMLLFVRPAIAEAAQRILDAIDLTDAQSLAEESNLDMERVIGAFLSGDFESAFSTVEWRSVADRLFADGASKLIRALIPPIGLSLLMRLMLKKGAAMQRAARFVCRAACVILLAGNFSNVAASARQVFAISEKCISAITPAMVTAAAFTGADGTSAVISPAAALAGGAIRDCLSSGGMTLAISAATIAAAGNMAEGISLERLFRLIRQTAQTLSGVLVAAFMGMTALGVRMGAARDGAMRQRFGIARRAACDGGDGQKRNWRDRTVPDRCGVLFADCAYRNQYADFEVHLGGFRTGAGRYADCDDRSVCRCGRNSAGDQHPRRASGCDFDGRLHRDRRG